MLRSMLEKHMPGIFNKSTEGKLLDAKVEDSVLGALLEVPEYRHGTRSMEALIKMCLATPRKHDKLVAAMIPPRQQLELHVDSKTFLSLIEKNKKTGS